MTLRKQVTTIIFDIDGTLSEDISWLKLTEGLGASPEYLRKLLYSFRSGKIDYPEAKKLLLKLWSDTGNTNKLFMQDMFRSWNLKHDAVEIINFLKKDYQLCLISGAVDLYVEIVAEKLGIDNWYANTELVWDTNGNLVDLHYYSDQAQKKWEHFNEFISLNKIDKNKCAVVGDEDNDLILFKELKYGIAVNKESHPELEKLAYKSIKNLEELREIF